MQKRNLEEVLDIIKLACLDNGMLEHRESIDYIEATKGDDSVIYPLSILNLNFITNLNDVPNKKILVNEIEFNLALLNTITKNIPVADIKVVLLQVYDFANSIARRLMIELGMNSVTLLPLYNSFNDVVTGISINFKVEFIYKLPDTSPIC